MLEAIKQNIEIKTLKSAIAVEENKRKLEEKYTQLRALKETRNDRKELRKKERLLDRELEISLLMDELEAYKR